MTSPTCTPMGVSMRRWSGSDSFWRACSAWIACAQRVAFTTESNSAKTESPAVSTTRPSSSSTCASTRWWKARISRVVHSSSLPIRRLKPETSTIRMAASLRRERGASASNPRPRARQLAHEAEELEPVGHALLPAAPLAVERVHVHRDALRIAQAGKTSERELAGRVGGRESRVETLARAVAHVHQIVAHRERALRVAERPVAGHDHLGAELRDALAGGDPVRDRSRPHDRRSADEQDVARVHDALLRQPHQDVAPRVRRPDLDEHDLLRADAQAQLA